MRQAAANTVTDIHTGQSRILVVLILELFSSPILVVVVGELLVVTEVDVCMVGEIVGVGLGLPTGENCMELNIAVRSIETPDKLPARKERIAPDRVSENIPVLRDVCIARISSCVESLLSVIVRDTTGLMIVNFAAIE